MDNKTVAVKAELGIWRGASFANENQQTGFGEPGKEHPIATRLPASRRTREELTSLIERRLSTGSAKGKSATS